METVALWTRIGEVGGWTIAVSVMLITVELVRRGKLVPKRTVDAIIDQYKAEIDHIRKDYTERITQTMSVTNDRIGDALKREEYSRDSATMMLKVSSEQSAQISKLTSALGLGRSQMKDEGLSDD